MSISGLTPGLGYGGSQLLPQSPLTGSRTPISPLGGMSNAGLSSSPFGNPAGAGLPGSSIQGLGDGSMSTILQAIISMMMMILSMLMGMLGGGGAGGDAGAGSGGSSSGAPLGAPGTSAGKTIQPDPSSGPSNSGSPSNNGKVPDDQDENGKTAAQLNTTGPAAAVSDSEIAKAAGGDQKIESLLKKLNTDPEGHKELRLALDKGTTYHEGQLAGNVVGLTEYGGGGGPKITLESMSIDTVAHETAHAAYQDMSHAEVYRLGHRVESRLGKN